MKRKLLLAMLCIVSALGFKANAQTDVTASYIGNLDEAAGKNGEAYGHKESDGKGWWNNQTTGLGWHAFTKNGTAFESWTSGFGGAGVMIGRTMVLPSGNYTLSFKAFGCNATNSADPATMPSAGDVVAFLTGKDNVDITNTASAGDATFHDISYTFDVTTDNTAFEFGIKKLTDDSKIDWCQIKDVSLVLNSTDVFPVANNNVSGFTYSLGNEGDGWHTNTWSTEGQWDGSRFQVPFHELWKSKESGGLLNATITASHTPTETGVYKVSAWVRVVNENGGAVNGVKIFVRDAEADACSGSSVISGKGRLGTYTAMADGVAGTPFTFGFKINGSNANWLSFKNVTITYLGDLPQSEIDALLALVPTTQMNATVQSTLNGYVSALESVKSVANYNNLALYIPTAQASADEYSYIATAISTYATKAAALDAAGQAAYDASGVQTKYDNGTYVTRSEAEAELEAAYITAVKSQSEGSDWTSLITNPSFETGNFNGWTNSGMATQNNNSFGKTGTYYAEAWQPNGTKSVRQTISNIPAGKYRLTAHAKGRGVRYARIFAGSVYKNITIADSEDDYSVVFACESDEDFEIGFKGAGTGAGSSWLCVDNFRLEKISDLPDDVEPATGVMNQDLSDAQDDAITAYEANKNIANYNAANDARNAAQESVDNYILAKETLDAIKAVIDGTNVYTSDAFTTYNGSYTTYKGKYDGNTLTNAEAAELYNDVLPLVRIAGSSWHKDNTTDDFLLSAWTIGGEQCKDFDKSLYINTWSTEGDGDGSNFKTPFFEYWTSDANSLAATTIQATVPGLAVNTVYDITAIVRVRQTNDKTKEAEGITLKVGEGDAVDVTAGDQIGSSAFYMKEFTATGVTDASGNLVITFDVAENSNISWLSFKDVKYTPTVVKATISSASGFATLYTGYAIDFSGTGLEAYIGTYSKVGDDEFLNLEPVDDVPANTGVVLKGATGTYNIPVIASSETANGNLTGSINESTNVDDLKSSYDFYGLAVKDKDATPIEVQFTTVSGGIIAAGKAFLKLDKGAAAKVLRVVVDGQASEVTAPEVVETEEPEVLYNMAGIPVGKDFKGYVINQKGEKRLQR